MAGVGGSGAEGRGGTRQGKGGRGWVSGGGEGGFAIESEVCRGIELVRGDFPLVHQENIFITFKLTKVEKYFL